MNRYPLTTLCTGLLSSVIACGGADSSDLNDLNETAAAATSRACEIGDELFAGEELKIVARNLGGDKNYDVNVRIVDPATDETLESSSERVRTNDNGKLKYKFVPAAAGRIDVQVERHDRVRRTCDSAVAQAPYRAWWRDADGCRLTPSRPSAGQPIRVRATGVPTTGTYRVAFGRANAFDANYGRRVSKPGSYRPANDAGANNGSGELDVTVDSPNWAHSNGLVSITHQVRDGNGWRIFTSHVCAFDMD